MRSHQPLCPVLGGQDPGSPLSSMPSMGGLASSIPGQSRCPVGPTPSSPGICSSVSTCNGCGETFCHSQREVWSGLTPGITRQGSMLGLGSHGEYAEDWPDALLSCAWRVPHFAWCLGGHGIACAKSIFLRVPKESSARDRCCGRPPRWNVWLHCRIWRRPEFGQ